uniref:Uncharacterized protein n=1 Tax=Anopheles quadriannulatus TaxID=34691 RepID=A0A182XED0_ANOQN
MRNCASSSTITISGVVTAEGWGLLLPVVAPTTTNEPPAADYHRDWQVSSFLCRSSVFGPPVEGGRPPGPGVPPPPPPPPPITTSGPFVGVEAPLCDPTFIGPGVPPDEPGGGGPTPGGPPPLPGGAAPGGSRWCGGGPCCCCPCGPCGPCCCCCCWGGGTGLGSLPRKCTADWAAYSRDAFASSARYASISGL